MSSSKRPVVLMLILLVLLGSYLWYDRAKEVVTEYYELWKNPPLAGENRVGKLAVKQKDDSTWIATFEYFYTGKPMYASLSLASDSTIARPNWPGQRWHYAKPAERGLHTVTVEIQHPAQLQATAVTESVTAKMLRFSRDDKPAQEIAKATLAPHIKWPDHQMIANRPDAVLARAVNLIEAGEYRAAKGELDGLVARDPKFEQAYLELARIAMKSNWSPEGLRNAQGLIQTALQIHPDSTNAKILLAYVYQHQERYADADALYHEVERAGTTNVWHWANWGEWFQLQGRADEALAKYREGLTHPRTKEDSDRARPWMYTEAVDLLETRGDLDAAEAMYRKRIEEYPEYSCYSVMYGDFLLHRRGDADATLQKLRDLKDANCSGFAVAHLRGAAYYLKWSGTGAEAERAEALRQARVFLPTGPLMFYQLARSETAAAVARKLIAGGDKIGLQNSQQLDALALALANRDLPVVRRLLKLGARPDALVGEEKMPVALVPVLTRDLAAVQVLQKAGVDYSRVRFQGVTAIDVARRNGDTELLRVLEPKGGGLSS